MKTFFKSTKRLVLKIGSSLLINEENHPNHEWLATLAKDISELEKNGIQTVIVTSGAVALGARYLNKPRRAMKLEDKQAAAACGQLALVKAYQEAFSKHGIPVAQILLTLEDSENRKRYLNARTTIETLLNAGIIPVINENDTVATAELKFGDNDRLAARVAQMIAADMLILLSDIDGLYTADPSKNKKAEFIAEVDGIDSRIESMAKESASDVGSGGMVTKIAAAKMAVAAGCQTIITLGKNNHPLKELGAGARHTRFVSHENPEKARKSWIADNLNTKGEALIDAGALAALKRGGSLLPAGVKELKGNFERGDTIRIKSPANKEVGRGLAKYSSAEARTIIGHKSKEIEAILGFSQGDELIHRDDMVLKI